MASLYVLCPDPRNIFEWNYLKSKLEKNVTEYFVARQKLFKLFHGPSINVWINSRHLKKPSDSPSYILNVRRSLMTNYKVVLLISQFAHCLDKIIKQLQQHLRLHLIFGKSHIKSQKSLIRNHNFLVNYFSAGKWFSFVVCLTIQIFKSTNNLIS